ncbi:hypothetical protein Nepgr_007226 [Nepenthes gracilis]|uniref:Uncharacterized protein n=1 Tax=Nepenthes gracilis TaxID=150966 RepID=A0AAD3XIA5_NEPGR|nr:hypothetical protein Nepgr_007226 [Nepenthes gracilis]
MGRAPCCDKNGLKKGPWTTEEDQKLIEYIQKHGSGNWRTLPKNAGLQRCGKSCRLRWTNYLRPDIKRGRFSLEEEDTIIQLHSILGNKWSAIAAHLPGRTDNEIKNYWNTHIRKRLLRMGIDPVTHNPRLDLLDLSSILNSSLYNVSSQMSTTSLFGLRPLFNPELLRLATSLLSTRAENPNLFMQNLQQNQLSSSTQIENQLTHVLQSSQIQPPVHNILTCTTTTTTNTATTCIPFPSEPQVMEPNKEPYPSNTTDFDAQNFGDQSWLSCDFVEEYVSQPSFNDFYGTEIMDVNSSQNSTFRSNDSSNQNFNIASVFSTPSSSPKLLNSNSNSAFVNSSSTTTTTAEDERESYCSSMITKFRIPDILRGSEFM